MLFSKSIPNQTSRIDKHGSISIVIALFGRFSINQNFLAQVQSYLREISSDDDEQTMEVVVVHAGGQWRTLPTLQSLSARFSRVKTVEAPEQALPAHIFNIGLKASSGARMIFLSPDEPLNKKFLQRLIAICSADPNGDSVIGIYDLSESARLDLPGEPPAALLYGWLLNAKILQLSHLAIPRRAMRTIGGFDESPLLQLSSSWDLALRLSANWDIKLVPDRKDTSIPSDLWANFPKPNPVSEDLRQRYLSRCLSNEGTTVRERMFLNDLPFEDVDYLQRHINIGARPDPRGTRRLKITITGSYWEYHHNWLCFLNYFNHLEGTGFGTFKSVFDHLVTLADIEDSDIVILSRCKVSNVRQIIDWCRDLKIPTVYMIDDNWMTVAEDWPDTYRNVFGPDTDFYRNFLFGIKNADYVLTYNKILAEDVARYAKRIVMLPNSVDLSAFERNPRKETGRYVIGYTGSQRYSLAPFKALGDVAKQNQNIDIVIFGSLTAEQEGVLGRTNIIRYPMVSYDKYRELIRAISPDILLAPLDASRTSRSKCPNKYLEITAAGAVGIYSDIEPYNWHITHGINGLLVSDDTEWADSLCRLLNKEVLAEMRANAREDIVANYDAPKVASQFVDLMRSIADGVSRC